MVTGKEVVAGARTPEPPTRVVVGGEEVASMVLVTPVYVGRTPVLVLPIAVVGGLPHWRLDGCKLVFCEFIPVLKKLPHAQIPIPRERS